jgi:hypothetical protein
MIGGPLNPFRPTRWEHQKEGHQLIWYSKLADDLAAEKSVYVSGSRGSGKTTLLKSICWEDLARNASLRLQKTIADVSAIGAYIRFPDHLTAALANVDWATTYPAAPNPELEAHRYFSFLVEITCAERAITACHELRVLEFAQIDVRDELGFPKKILDEFPRIKVFPDIESELVRTLPDVSRVLRIVSRRMNEAAARGTVKALNEALPSREPGEFLAFVTEGLAKIVRLKARHGLRAPWFKFCLDDCEVLNTSQQISINTLVRTSKSPISWVVSYVGSQFENSRTYLSQQPLTEADRRVESLDSREDEDFRDLCQAVVSLRLMFSVSESARSERKIDKIQEFFPLSARLGRRDVNEMMELMVRRSTSPIAGRLKQCSERLRDWQISEGSKPDRQNPRELPLFQTYVLLHWQDRAKAFKTEFDSSDEAQLIERAKAIQSDAGAAWLRRKQRAALLHLSSVLGFKTLPLAGASVIISLADRSIRDFLEILGFIFEAYAKRHRLDVSDRSSLDKFAASRTQIAYAIQTEGIYAASGAYHAGVSARGERDFDVILRLVDGLGYLTSQLQSDSSDATVFGRAERGLFSIHFEALSVDSLAPAAARERLVWSTLRQAELAGYIRTVDASSRDILSQEDPDGRSLMVRLHRRLAPYFRFSYRGPYESTALQASEVWLLCDRANPTDPRVWADSMKTKSFSESQQALSFSWPEHQ